MKNIYMKYSLLTLIILSLLVYGCDTWEDDINVDPNYTSETPDSDSDYDYDPSEFMLDMIWYVVRGRDYIHWNVFSAVCEYHGKTKSLSQGNRHQAWHAFDDAAYDGPWGSGYEAVRYIRNMRNAAEKISDEDYETIATIWECYDFFNLTLLYGNIPYSQSIIDDAPSTPVYDEQETIYHTLMRKLLAASERINPTSSIDSETDLIYGGDMNQWKKFANTLLIRYAMYMTDADNDSACIYLNKILNDPDTYPIMESNSDNAAFHYDGSEYYSRYYLLSAAKIEEAPFSNIFIERLVSIKDPRLPIYARPVDKTHEDATMNVLPSNSGTSKYAGHLYGITSDNSYSGVWNGGSNYASKLGEYFRTEDSESAATSECATVPVNLATYSEMLFFLSEATEEGWIATGTTAEEYYEQAIEASFEQYDASFTSTKYENAFAESDRLSSVEDYLAQEQVDYDGGRDHLTLIAEQKWIADFLLMFEPYFDHRRTMLPAMRASSGAEYGYSTTGSGNKFPSRAAYPTSEASTNATNYADARANGFDIAITGQATRNEALMWLLQSDEKDQDWLIMPEFNEPVNPEEYPVRDADATYGTSFKDWYDENWNAMFWWLNE